MKSEREIKIMLKTHETMKNNLSKQMYLPPYTSIDTQLNLERMKELDIKVQVLKWVLNEKETKAVVFPTSTLGKVKAIGAIVVSLFSNKEPIYIELNDERPIKYSPEFLRAVKKIWRIKGQEYAPDVHEIQNEINEIMKESETKNILKLGDKFTDVNSSKINEVFTVTRIDEEYIYDEFGWVRLFKNCKLLDK